MENNNATDNNTTDKKTTEDIKPVITIPMKSSGISIILTILFGPIGMFYSTVSGAIIMCAISLVVGVLSAGTLLPFCYIISIIWGAISVSTYNTKLVQNYTTATIIQ
jgi:hypothetical protein